MPDLLPCQFCGHHARLHYVDYFGDQYDPVSTHYEQPHLFQNATDFQQYLVYVHNEVNTANSEKPEWGGGNWTVPQMTQHVHELATHKSNSIFTGLSSETGNSDLTNPDFWGPSLWQSLLFQAYAGPQNETVNEGAQRLSSFRYQLQHLEYIVPRQYRDTVKQVRDKVCGPPPNGCMVHSREENFKAIVDIHNEMSRVLRKRSYTYEETKGFTEHLLSSCHGCNYDKGFVTDFCNKDEGQCNRCLSQQSLLLL
jgi:hypothetical protein